MRYPEEIIEEVRSKNDIVDVVSSYIKIQKKGNSHFGLCPFHNEKSPSFSVSAHKQMYYCFGCGAGGNVFTFVMEYENYSFQEAMELLAKRAGVTLPEVEYTEEARQKESRRARLLEVNKEAAKFYYYQLHQEPDNLGMRYLVQRGLSDETIKGFGLGYSTKTGQGLLEYLQKKGYDSGLLCEAGLAAYSEKHGLSPKFWNRVMFPIQDINHRVIGFGGRVMGEGEPKYLNSQETPIFEKSRNLYGLNFARTSRASHLILCEGYMDVISMHQAGFTQAVASLGTAFTPGQANLIRRYTQEVLLAYDSDSAGVKAALRAITILRETGLSCKIINLSPYKDPDEFVKACGKDSLQERIQQAENSFFYELRILENDYHMQDPDSRTRFHKAIAEKIILFDEEIERENYIVAVAEKYMIQSNHLRSLVNTIAMKSGGIPMKERPKQTVQKKIDVEDAEKKKQRMLITWLSESPALYQQVSKYLSPQDFTDETYRQVAEVLFPGLATATANPAAIISMFSQESQQREIASMFNTRLPELGSTAEKEKAFMDLLCAVKKGSYDYYAQKLGTDTEALKQVILGKQALEELKRVKITMDES